MEYSFIIAVIPVILVVAFLVWIAKKITDGERLDMKEGVLGVVILMVAVLIMVPMISSTQVYTWDEDSGELVIQQNISGGSYAWDTYDSQIRSIVIKPGVTQIGNSAFDGATNLEYLNMPEGVTDIGTNAFGVLFKNYMGQAIELGAGEFVGIGDGSLYLCDDSIYTYNSQGMITGLASTASGATNLVFPREHNGTPIPAIANNSFKDNTAIVMAVSVPNSSSTIVGNAVFSGCSALAHAIIPDSTVTIGSDTFRSCTSLTSIELPEGVETIGATSFGFCTDLESITIPSTVTSIGNYCFNGCSGLEGFTIPAGLATIGTSLFNNCSSLESITIPSTVTSIGNDAFSGCTGITDVSFGSGFNATLGTNCFRAWTFYESDGTTTIDKTVVANLSGKTFQGTASALIEVEPGQLTLTPQQIQQVHLHDMELQDLKDQISIDPLPLQPSLQEQELTA